MKILIVDDNKDNLDLLEIWLKGSSYDVVSAANGAEALEKLRANGFDMIVSDILMPVMDGFELCRECKEDEKLKDIPFVFYTANYTDVKDEELALKVGADKFLRKPMEPDEFIKIIQGVIRDVEEGRVGQQKPVVEEEKEVFKLYSERLVNKLEEKMLDLEAEIARRKESEERIKHLNRVILAVRNVNQLITREKDRDRLLKGTCDALLAGREYYNVWTILLKETGELVTTAEAGLGKKLLPILERIKRGEMPHCVRLALSQAEVVAINDPHSTCTDCPLAVNYAERGGLAVRLEHAQKVYGVLILSVPYDSAPDDEEQRLIKEMAEDIALALHSIELEKEQNKAVEEIRRMGEEWMLTFDSITDWVSIQDKDFKIVRANRAYADKFNMKPEELIGKPCYEVVHGTKEPWPSCPHRQTLETKKPATEEFFEPHLGIYLEITTSPIFNENGEATGTIHITKDITERKRAEEELEKHRERLEELVKERTAELTKANQHLRQQIEERKKAEDELKKRTDEMQTMVNLMAGREVRMAELKETIQKLRTQIESAGLTPVADDPLKEI